MEVRPDPQQWLPSTHRTPYATTGDAVRPPAGLWHKAGVLPSPALCPVCWLLHGPIVHSRTVQRWPSGPILDALAGAFARNQERFSALPRPSPSVGGNIGCREATTPQPHVVRGAGMLGALECPACCGGCSCSL